MVAPLLLLLVPASAGMMAYHRTRRSTLRAGWSVWFAYLVVAFVAIRAWYTGHSHCEGAATIFVPFVGAFAAASGAWVGITRAGNVERDYWLPRVGLESAVMSLVPGVFFILLLWPCG